MRKIGTPNKFFCLEAQINFQVLEVPPLKFARSPKFLVKLFRWEERKYNIYFLQVRKKLKIILIAL